MGAVNFILQVVRSDPSGLSTHITNLMFGPLRIIARVLNIGTGSLVICKQRSYRLRTAFYYREYMTWTMHDGARPRWVLHGGQARYPYRNPERWCRTEQPGVQLQMPTPFLSVVHASERDLFPSSSFGSVKLRLRCHPCPGLVTRLVWPPPTKGSTRLCGCMTVN